VAGRGQNASPTPDRRGSAPDALSLSPACPGDATAPCHVPGPPPNPIAAEPGDGWVLSRPSSRVHEPRNSPDAVVLRSQTVLTGSGSHRYSYGGFGGGHPHFHPHNGGRKPNFTSLVLSAWEVCGVADPLPADRLICGPIGHPSVVDRERPPALVRSGTWQARASLSQTRAWACDPSVMRQYATRSAKARVTAAVRLETWSRV
jgi:hypothetical protein